MPHLHLRGSGVPRFVLVVLILATALVACAEPVIQIGSEAAPSPTSTVASLGRLVDGEQSADLALVGTSNDLWNLQAAVSFPGAASVDSVTLYTTRSDLPGAEQYVVQHILDSSPAMLDLTLPHLADGQRVYVRIDMQIDAEARSLGHVQLEAAAGRWHVVELVSTESAGDSYAEEGREGSPTHHEASAEPTPTSETEHVADLHAGDAPVETATVPTEAVAATDTPGAEHIVEEEPTEPIPTHTPASLPTATLAPIPTATPLSAYVVRIKEPANDETIRDAVIVRGEALAAENLVIVQVLDAVGDVLAQQQALIRADLGQAGPFEVIMPFPQVRLSQYGFIHAYVIDPADNSIGAETSVRVNLQGSQTLPTREPELPAITPEALPALVEITEPPDGAIVRDTVTVRGNGRAFENSLVVQVREFSGRVLGESIAHIDATNVGQVGSWVAQVQVSGVVIARQGQIYVYAVNAKDGSVEADDMVEVWLAASR